MATIKSYTDISQSKKLAEILPLESADMIWVLANPDLPMIRAIAYEDSEKSKYYEILPAWSLAALLDVLPTLDSRNAVLCKDIRYDEWHICYHSTATLSVIDTERYNNPVDACYEMIIKLKERNLI